MRATLFNRFITPWLKPSHPKNQQLYPTPSVDNKITVRIWRSLKSGGQNVGHVSIEIQDCYMSFWPASFRLEDQEAPLSELGVHIKRQTILGIFDSVQYRFSDHFETDEAIEKRPPEVFLNFYGLNKTEMQKKFFEIKENVKGWRVFGGNLNCKQFPTIKLLTIPLSLEQNVSVIEGREIFIYKTYKNSCHSYNLVFRDKKEPCSKSCHIEDKSLIDELDLIPLNNKPCDQQIAAQLLPKIEAIVLENDGIVPKVNYSCASLAHEVLLAGEINKRYKIDANPSVPTFFIWMVIGTWLNFMNFLPYRFLSWRAVDWLTVLTIGVCSPRFIQDNFVVTPDNLADLLLCRKNEELQKYPITKQFDEQETALRKYFTIN